MTISYGNSINNPTVGGGGGGGASTAMDVSVTTGGFQVITGKNVQTALGQVDTKLALNENYDSILLSLDPLETDIGAISQVPLQSLQTQMHDGRPSHKASGSIVYDEFGTYGVIDTIEGQTANVATLTKAGAGAGGGVANAIKDQNKGGAIYDWVGTLAEYNAQNVATNHPDWVCYITDDVLNESNIANTSLSNLTAEGKSTIVKLAMLSESYDTLSLGASGSWYTAPADGYFYLARFTKGQEFIQLYNGVDCFIQQTGLDNWLLTALLPVAKGKRCQCNYNTTGNIEAFRFIYAEGSKK